MRLRDFFKEWNILRKASKSSKNKSVSLTSDKITVIARRHFGVKNLRTDNNDEENSYTVMVWEIKAALEDAYNAGRQEAEQKAKVVDYIRRIK